MLGGLARTTLAAGGQSIHGSSPSLAFNSEIRGRTLSYGACIPARNGAWNEGSVRQCDQERRAKTDDKLMLLHANQMEGPPHAEWKLLLSKHARQVACEQDPIDYGLHSCLKYNLGQDGETGVESSRNQCRPKRMLEGIHHSIYKKVHERHNIGCSASIV